MANLAQQPEALVALRQMIHGKWISKTIALVSIVEGAPV